MNRLLKFSAIALFSLVILVPAASAQRGGGRGFGGGGFGGGRGFGGGGYYGRGFGGGYSGWWGGGYWGPGWGWYNPYWYGYGWGHPYGYGYGYGSYGYPYSYSYGSERPTGSVKIEKVPKNDAVYVDGGYAGTVGDLSKFKLRTGSHDIEVRDQSGHTIDKEHIQVLAGKTLEIHANQGGH